MNISQKTKELAHILSLPALTGHISILAASGLLTLKSAPLIGLVFIAGPVALFLAASLGGTIKQNVLAVLFASFIATTALIIATIIGASLLHIVDIRILQITGGVVLLIIALTLFGLKIPSAVSISILLIGVSVSIVKKVVL